MTASPNPRGRDDAGPEASPVEVESSRIIDIATRSALPSRPVRQRDERLGMFAGLAVVVLLVGMTVWTIRESQVKPGRPAAERPAPQAGWRGSQPLPGLPGDRELGIDVPPPLPDGSAPYPDPAASLPAPALSPVLAQPSLLPEVTIEPSSEPAAKRSASPTVVYQSGSGDSGVGFAFEPGSGSEFGAAGKSDRAPVAVSGGKAALAGSVAERRATLGKGTRIPAILETAIDSTVPGGVRAVVSTDVLSPDGKLALIPRSSRLVGQYRTRRTGGQNSAYVVWTQIQRPDGTRLDLPSAMAGASEKQYFERFGQAGLVSVVAGPAGADLRARQGEPVRIMAARDVDLSTGR